MTSERLDNQALRTLRALLPEVLFGDRGAESRHN